LLFTNADRTWAGFVGRSGKEQRDGERKLKPSAFRRAYSPDRKIEHSLLLVILACGEAQCGEAAIKGARNLFRFNPRWGDDSGDRRRLSSFAREAE
jgi:hypothetical protein